MSTGHKLFNALAVLVLLALATLFIAVLFDLEAR